jgi:hypothetical protein
VPRTADYSERISNLEGYFRWASSSDRFFEGTIEVSHSLVCRDGNDAIPTRPNLTIFGDHQRGRMRRLYHRVPPSRYQLN